MFDSYNINNFKKKRVLRILVLLAILSFFPLFTSNLQNDKKITQYKARAQPAQTGNIVNATSSAQKVFWIYGGPLVGDQPAVGWGSSTTYGAGNTVNLTNTSPVYAGVHSIAYQVTAPYQDKCVMAIMNAGDPSLDITPYSYLTFYARGTRIGQSYGVSLIGTGGTVMGNTLPMINYGGAIPIDNWFIYNIPVTAFNATSKQIRGVQFSDVTGSAQPNVFIDDIAFSEVRGETIQPVKPIGPPAAPLPPATRVPDYYPQISPWVYIIPFLIIFVAIIFQ